MYAFIIYINVFVVVFFFFFFRSCLSTSISLAALEAIPIFTMSKKKNCFSLVHEKKKTRREQGQEKKKKTPMAMGCRGNQLFLNQHTSEKKKKKFNNNNN